MNNVNLINEDAPDFQIGDDVVVFLYQTNMGSGYNTEGDYYYVLGVNQGAYFAQNTRDGVIHFANAYGNLITEEQIASTVKIRKMSRKTQDSNRFYNEFIHNLNLNLESGFIDREEYEQLLKETQEYAVILE